MRQISVDRPIAIFYGGTNGSGKTTLRAAYDDQSIDIHIDPDQIARKINPQDPRSVDMAAGKEALRLFELALEENKSFTMESTLTGKSILRRMDKTASQGYHTELRYIGLASSDMNVERVHQRVARGGHSIDDDVVRKRYQESRDNLIHAAKIADRIVIWDNSGPSANSIATIENGTLKKNPDIEMPVWVNNVLQELGYARHQLSPYDIKENGLQSSNKIFEQLSISKNNDDELKPK